MADKKSVATVFAPVDDVSEVPPCCLSPFPRPSVGHTQAWCTIDQMSTYYTCFRTPLITLYRAYPCCFSLQAWYTIDKMFTYYTGNISAKLFPPHTDSAVLILAVSLPLNQCFPQAWYTIDQMSTYYTGNISAITRNKKALTNLLKYHIVDGKAIRASALKDKQKLDMMNGESVTVHVTKR